MAARTYAQIQAEINLLMDEAERLKRKESREAQDVLKRIRKAIAVYGFSADDVFGEEPPKTVRKPATAKKRRPGWPAGRKKPIKYQDTAGNTWAGGGSMPRWLRAHVDAGHDIDDFLVRRAA